MPSYIWEDPFNETRDAPQPRLWTPHAPQPPVSLKHIQRRQKELLRPLNNLRRAALEVLRRVKNDRLLPATLQAPVTVEILYRHPENPHVMSVFGPVALVDYPIPLSASVKPEIPVIDHLLPTQRIVDLQKRPDRNLLLDHEAGMGLIRHYGVSDGSASPDKIVVYPQLLRLVARWITGMQTPISDVRYYEVERNAVGNICSSWTPGAPNAPDLH